MSGQSTARIWGSEASTSIIAALFSKMGLTGRRIVMVDIVLLASSSIFSGEKRHKAHKHKHFALVNVQMALGQTAGCPRFNRAKKFMCSPQNTGNISFFPLVNRRLSQGCPDFQKVYVFKVYVPFSCPIFVSTVDMDGAGVSL